VVKFDVLLIYFERLVSMIRPVCGTMFWIVGQ